MKPFVSSLDRLASANSHFRHVLFTGKHHQLVVMAIPPGDDIGREIHAEVDQFFRVEEGVARFVFGPGEEHLARAGDAVVVPAGTFHNVINASPTKLLRIFTLYSSPQHTDGAIQRTKADAMTAQRS